MSELLIKNVLLIDGVHKPELTDVLIRGGLIAQKEPANTISSCQGTVIDGMGKTLAPGLWDGHTHLENGLIGTWEEKMKICQNHLASYLKYGITTAVDCGGDVDELAAVKDYAENHPGEVAGLAFAGPCFTGINGHPTNLPHGRTHGIMVGADTDIYSHVRAVTEKGVDFIKILYDHGKPGSEIIPEEKLCKIVDAAHEAGKHVIIHIDTMEEFRNAANARPDRIEHCPIPESVDNEANAEEMIRLLKDGNICFCPTFSVWEQIAHVGDAEYVDMIQSSGFGFSSDEEARMIADNLNKKKAYLPDAQKCMNRTDYCKRFLKAMSDAGITLTIGDDAALLTSRPGSLMREIEIFSQCGISAEEIIAAATVNNARSLGFKGKEGTLEIGALADAILLSGDPRTDINYLTHREYHEAVLRHGYVIDSKKTDFDGGICR